MNTPETPRTPMESLLGRTGEAPKCVERGEVSMHWWPIDAKTGDLCLCGKRPKPKGDPNAWDTRGVCATRWPGSLPSLCREAEREGGVVTDLPIDEREAWFRWLQGVAAEAMNTVPSELLSGTERRRLKAAWEAAREYSKQREEKLIEALRRADELLMAANGALGRARAHAYDAPDRDILVTSLEDVRARLAAVSDTTLTALAECGALAENGDTDPGALGDRRPGT